MNQKISQGKGKKYLRKLQKKTQVESNNLLNTAKSKSKLISTRVTEQLWQTFNLLQATEANVSFPPAKSLHKMEISFSVFPPFLSLSLFPIIKRQLQRGQMRPSARAVSLDYRLTYGLIEKLHKCICNFKCVC